MSEQYDNRHRGVLFKNDRKESDRHPDYKGNYTDENGKQWDLAAWLKKDRNGKTYMQLKTSEDRRPKPTSQDYRQDPRGQAQQHDRRERQPETHQPPPPPPLDDDIPFAPLRELP